MQATNDSAQRKRRMKKIFGLFALAVLCFWTALMLFVDRYGQRDRAAGVKDAQAIVILGARIKPSGELGVSLQSRAERALALYRAGAAPKFICTGGLGTYPPEESVATSLWLQARGVPTGDILLEKTSTSTWENLQNVAELCRRHGWKRIVIVSDPYHLWRAERDARALGLEPIVSPSANQAPALRLWMTFRETFAVLRDLVS